MKKIATLLLVLISLASFAQDKPKPAAPAPAAPALTDQQKKDLLKFQIRFVDLSQQLKSAQDGAKSAQDGIKVLQQEYTDYSKNLCAAAGDQKYTVDLGDGKSDPSCKEMLPPPAPAKK